MGQSWIIANLDKREFIPCGRLKDGLQGYGGACIVLDCFRTWKVDVFPLDPAPTWEQAVCPIIDLPLEVIERIYDYLRDDILDVLSFACTSSILWNAGTRPVRDEIQANFGNTWADDRLICIGEYGSDYPQQALSYKEKKELAAFQGHPIAPQSLFKMAERLFKERKQPSKMSQWDCAGRTLRLSGRFSGLEWETMRDLIDVDILHPQVMNMAPFVLRNLTKNEYVRAAALQDMLDEMAQRNYMDRPRAYHWKSATLIQVLIICICWSDYADVPSPTKFALHRGIWAGDRFDFTTVDAIYCDRRSLNGPQAAWTDVSETVLEAFREVWMRIN